MYSEGTGAHRRIAKIVLIGAYGIGAGSGVADPSAISIYENLLHLGTCRTGKLVLIYCFRDFEKILAKIFPIGTLYKNDDSAICGLIYLLHLGTCKTRKDDCAIYAYENLLHLGACRTRKLVPTVLLGTKSTILILDFQKKFS